MTDLSSIAQALESATEYPRAQEVIDLEEALLELVPDDKRETVRRTVDLQRLPLPFTRSVDAALAFAEAVLPETPFKIMHNTVIGTWHVGLAPDFRSASHLSLPLAICLAVVRALMAKVDD